MRKTFDRAKRKKNRKHKNPLFVSIGDWDSAYGHLISDLLNELEEEHMGLSSEVWQEMNEKYNIKISV